MIDSPTPRTCFALTVLAGLAWQLYVVVLAWRNAPRLHGLLEGFGGELPAVTHAFFATYRWWWLLPLLTTVLLADVWRRRVTPPPYALAVAAIALFPTLILYVWLHEALFQPMFAIIDAVNGIQATP